MKLYWSIYSAPFQEPDEFLQRLNFGAAADIKENKPLSTKDKGWNCLINFFCHFVFDPFSGKDQTHRAVRRFFLAVFTLLWDKLDAIACFNS